MLLNIEKCPSQCPKAQVLESLVLSTNINKSEDRQFTVTSEKEKHHIVASDKLDLGNVWSFLTEIMQSIDYQHSSQLIFCFIVCRTK